MTSTPARSGMPEHFGIRITDAAKDKLVGELDVDDRHLNNSGHVHGVRWRRSPMILAEDWPGSTSRLGFGPPRLEGPMRLSRANIPLASEDRTHSQAI